jgi:hypothetical protein
MVVVITIELTHQDSNNRNKTEWHLFLLHLQYLARAFMTSEMTGFSELLRQAKQGSINAFRAFCMGETGSTLSVCISGSVRVWVGCVILTVLKCYWVQGGSYSSTVVDRRIQNSQKRSNWQWRNNETIGSIIGSSASPNHDDTMSYHSIARSRLFLCPVWTSAIGIRSRNVFVSTASGACSIYFVGGMFWRYY